MYVYTYICILESNFCLSLWFSKSSGKKTWCYYKEGDTSTGYSLETRLPESRVDFFSFLFFCFCCFLFLKWGNKTNITENDMLTEKVLACLSTSKQTKLPLQQLRTYSNFPHPPQLWHFCLWGKSSSALCSSPLLSVCVTSPKYSLSYWRPVQPVLCPSDVFTTLCPTPPHLSFCQGNFCLLRHSSLLLPHPNPTPTPSALTYTS